MFWLTASATPAAAQRSTHSLASRYDMASGFWARIPRMWSLCAPAWRMRAGWVGPAIKHPVLADARDGQVELYVSNQVLMRIVGRDHLADEQRTDVLPAYFGEGELGREVRVGCQVRFRHRDAPAAR